MVEEEKNPYTWQIRFTGVVDYAGLIRLISDWLVNKGYEVHNKKDKHKMKDNGTADTEYKLFAWRNLTEFIRWRVEIDIWGWDEANVEVVKDGKKKVFQNMRLWVRIYSWLWYDFTNRFEKNNFTIALRTFLLKKVLVHRLDSFEGDMLHYKMLDLFTEIKQFLGMSSQGNEFADVW